jgi:hypothetical protein
MAVMDMSGMVDGGALRYGSDGVLLDEAQQVNFMGFGMMPLMNWFDRQ